MRGFYRGKATGAFAEAGVVNEAGVVRNTTSLEVTLIATLQCEQFIRLLRQ